MKIKASYWHKIFSIQINSIKDFLKYIFIALDNATIIEFSSLKDKID